MKIENDFFRKYSILEIQYLLKNKTIKPLDIFKYSLKKINHHKKFKFLTSNSYNFLKKLNLKDKFNFNINRPLTCMPFLAKDIFNTKDFYTEMGSSIWKNFRAGNNARVIDNLIDDGAILIGKSTTAEFAVHYETNCRNALDSNRIPGTSSTGSAVSVALGVVPFALGTQTAGSLTRPASYNGIWSMKPSFGMIPRTGILKTCDTLDTIGFLTSNFENLEVVLNSLRVRGKNYPYINENVDLAKDTIPKDIKIGFIKTHTWKNLEEYNQTQILNYVKKISKYFHLDEIELSNEFLDIHSLHTKIYHKSLSYYFKREKKLGRKLSNIIKKNIKQGELVGNADFLDALEKQTYLFNEFDKLVSNYDLIIAPGTSGIAPLKNNVEKDDSSLIWTFLHLPTIFAPVFRGPKNLPFGLQFVSRKWNDFKLIRTLKILRKNSLL